MRRVGVFLAVLATAAFAVGAALLPQGIGVIQDRQQLGRTAYTNEQSLSLNLTDTEMTFLDRMSIYGKMNFQISDMPSSEMTLSAEEALALGVEAINAFLEPWGGEVSSFSNQWAELLWNQEEGWQFRAWRVGCYDGWNNYFIVVLDDETGGLLSIACNGDMSMFFSALWGIGSDDEIEFIDLLAKGVGNEFARLEVWAFLDQIADHIPQDSDVPVVMGVMDGSAYRDSAEQVVYEFPCAAGEQQLTVEVQVTSFGFGLTAWQDGDLTETGSEAVTEWNGEMEQAYGPEEDSNAAAYDVG